MPAAVQMPEPCSIIVAFQRGRTTVLSARTLVALHLETFGQCAQKLLLLLDHDVREQVEGRKISVQTYSSGDFLRRRMVCAELSGLIRDSVSVGLNSYVFICEEGVILPPVAPPNAFSLLLQKDMALPPEFVPVLGELTYEKLLWNEIRGRCESRGLLVNRVDVASCS